MSVTGKSTDVLVEIQDEVEPFVGGDQEDGLGLEPVVPVKDHVQGHAEAEDVHVDRPVVTMGSHHPGFSRNLKNSHKNSEINYYFLFFAKEKLKQK